VATAAPALAGTVVLGPGSPARTYTVWRTPVVRGKDGKLSTATKCGSWKSTRVETPPPPAGWTGADFDDRYWSVQSAPRASKPGDSGDRFMNHDYGQSRGYKMMPALATFCLRTRFKVAAPGKMKLSMIFRGGAVVYVNGKEVARRHLPKGELKPDTLAEDYPQEAYGPSSSKPVKYHHTSPKNSAKYLKARLRRLEVDVPAKALKPGVNVLCVAVYRAPYLGNEIAKMRRGHIGYVWATCGLVDLSLTGPGTPNVKRPAGVQLWAASPVQKPGAGDFACPLEKPQPVEISAARGGTFTGKAVASSATGFALSGATVTDLEHSGGKGSIAAKSVEIRYGLDALLKKAPGKVARVLNRRRKPAGGAIASVWLKVRVPADAAPGTYSGKLTVNAGGAKTLPVKLTVADWRVPSPRDWETIQGFVQSPESVAIRYKVPLWSDAHFKRMEESFKLMGEAGGKKIVIYLAGRSCLGNEHTMVRWIKDPKAPGGYRHDFSVVDRYLDMALKHIRPRVTVLYVWEKYMGGHGRFAYISKARKKGNAQVTLLDPASGKMSLMKGPVMDGEEFNFARAKAFWKPVVDGVMQRLKKRGIGKTAFLGMVGDGKPSGAAVKTFKALIPSALWTENGHVIRIGQDFGGVKVGYATAVYTGQPSPPGNGKKRNPMLTLFPRYGQFFNTRLSEWSKPALHRHVTEMTTLTGMNGIGRFGMDFWPFRKKKDRKVRDSSPTISGRFPESNQAQLNIHHSTCHLLEPGPDGAVPSARYENLREGIQETQARLFIEKALSTGRINGTLGKRARAVLDERTMLLRAGLVGSDWDWCEGATPELARKLYSVAAEVAQRTGGN
jgi:hypothetical protein